MSYASPVYRFVSSLLSLLLVLQSVAPALFYSPTAVAQPTQPASTLIEADLTPLTIARVQSSYQAGNTAVVTYTIRNNQSARNYPQIAPGLTVTDTVAALADFDPLADPNTLRNIVVRHELTNGATLLSASVLPAGEGEQTRYHLGDLAPLADAVLTMTVQLPPTAVDFTTLDNGGATAYATHHGREVTANAQPLRLAPDNFAQWLISTPDAALQDTAMLLQAARIGDDPLDLFAYVQTFAYHAYEGSLRGTRGTLWSEAGNSVDQSSLLIALLRSAGYPARYRHGTLPTAEAQTLIASMFPRPTAVRGTVPPSAETSDPLNDPDLLALAQDHWWVEAYLPGQGWTTLDPTVGTSGTTPAIPLGDSTDQIAELPASLRHMLHFTLDVERYSDFPLGGLNLQTNTVLTASVPSAQTAGTPVSLGFAVDSETVSGLVTATTLHTYSPYLVYGEPETTLYGTAVEDILTTFPLATRYTTAVWLEVTSTAPNGQSDTYRRTIKDLIGADGRLGGAVQLPARDNSPLLSTSDLMQVQPIPNSGYPAEEAARQFNAIYQQTPAMVAAFEAYAEINEESDEATITEFVNDQLGAVYTAQFAQLDLMTALFQFGSTWEGRPIRPETALVTSYPSQPKLILTSQVVSAEGTLDTTFELLNIAEKAIAYPGQNQEAVKSANFLRTTAEKSLEYELLTLFLPGNDVRSAVAVMTTAGEQNIPTRFIVAENLAELDELAIPELTKAHIAGYAQEGALIWVPEQMVPMPYGEDIGFMVVAPDGSATYINADGFAASALVTYVTKIKTIAITALIEGTGLGFVGGFIGYIFSFFAEVFIASLSLPPTDPGEFIGGIASGEAGDASGKGTILGLILAAKAAIPVALGGCSVNVACQSGVMAGYGFVVAALVAGLAGGALDPSLTDFWVADLPELAPATAVSFTHTTAPTLPAGTVTLNLPAAHHYASAPTLSSSWTGNGTQTADFDTLTATTAVLTQNGTTLGNGNLSANSGTAQWAGNGRAWTVNGSTSLASYSADTAGLTLSSSGVYTAVVASSATAQTAQIRAAQAILNNSDQFAGDFSATISSDLALSGQGTVPVPASATNHSYTLGAGQLMLSGLGAGSLTVGNTAVDTSNAQAVAIADYSGDVTLNSGNPRDQISLSGTADLFTFGVSSEQSSLPANQSTRLLTNIQANYSDSYRITVYAPDGWQVERDALAQTIITPTAKAALGTATLLITAESTQYPGLFASATLEVDVTPSTGVGLSVTPDPLFTVPMGVVQGTDYADPLTLNHAGDGRAEVPGAAFNVRLQNQATTAVSFDLTTSGLPAGWAVWSQAPQPRLDLAPGAAQTVGLYVVPPEGPLLSGDSAFPFTVTAVDTSNPANTTTANAVFTMPALPFPYLTADPLLQTVAPGQPVTISLRVQNVGNTAASFPITASVRAGHFSTAVVSPTLLTSPINFETGSLASNAVFETNLLLDTSTAVPGTTYFVQAQSVAGEYDPTALTAVQVASLLTAPLVETAACVAEPLATATKDLGAVITTLEGACADGNCPPSGRTDLLNAVDSYLGTLVKVGFEADTSAVTAVRDDIAAAETTAELTATFEPLITAVLPLGQAACVFTQHRPSARFTPYVAAVLLGETADFSLDVTNLGTLTTTYAITVSGLPSGDLLLNETIAPSDTAVLPVPVTPAALGTIDLTAVVAAQIPDSDTAQDTAVARLNVVDKFVQVTQVSADPAFVETGVSSATLRLEVANLAGVALPATAQTRLLAPDGTPQFSADLPLTILAGAPRTYDLTSLDTSGWAEGVYTITVNLLDEQNNLLPDGSGYGYLSVGQALGASHAVQPQVVAPGTVTVTTVISTEILAGVVQPNTAVFPLWPPTGLRPVITAPVSVPDPQLDWFTTVTETEMVETDTAVTDTLDLMPSPTTITGTIIVRYEQDEAAVTGSWSNLNNTRASNGSYIYADTAGESAEFSFTGTWVNVGFIADRFSGQADILIDGISQGTIDLYRREDTPLSFVYDGLAPGNHTLTVVALGTANAVALNDFVRLDYLDVYNGGSYADGFFEQDDNRLFSSTGWSNVNDANASGGSYQRSGNATMWFPFTGDSVTYQAVAYPTGGLIQIALDGVYQTTLDLYNPLESITRTLSFDGLGAGPHVLQVTTYRNNATIDGFATPGTSPFYAPGTVGSFHRYEDDDPALRYNGLPYTTTSSSWSRYTAYAVVSDGQTIYANTAGDTASLTFTGTWVSVGFMADELSGQAEIFLDGVSQGTVDLYRNERDVTSVTYADLTPGTHTISVTVLGTANPLSGNTSVYLDYVDVWDGTSLPDGSFEELHGRVYLSGGWTNSANAGASGGTFNESGQAAIAWFPFTGDSVTYQALDYFRSDEAAIYIDEIFQGYYDLRTGLAPTITHSFANLGPGLHMLKIRGYRRDITLDAFHTPAISPPAPTPTPTVFTRYEEDAPNIRYNGLPYTSTARSWDRPFDVFRVSDGQFFDTYAPGDSVSLDFAGTWLGVGFATSRFGGQVEVTIDGVSQGMVDLYTPDDDVLFRAYGDLSDTAHTITLTLLASRHPNSSGTGLLLDYFETWNGDPLPSATYEEDHPLVYRSDLYDDWDIFAEPAASGGAYMRSAFQGQSTAWFPFTGDSVTFMALANSAGDRVSISIDGEFVDTFNLYSATPTQRPLSFDGLGEGPHMMQVRYHLGYINVDAFVVPGIAPFYTPPVLTGIVRYEEDNTAVVYNNSHDFRTRPQSWAGLVASQASRQGNTSTATVGDSVSLTFHGRWVNLGFRTRSRAGEAEVFIDGQSQGLIDLTGTGEDNLAYQFGGLITGTHTISVVHVSGTMYFDYFDVWDGQPMSDDIVNARRSEDNPRLHYSSGLAEVSNPNAIEGDLLISSLLNTNSNIWYTFVGDAFSYYGFSRNNTTFVELYVDGVLIDTIDQSYPFSEQPIVHHYTGFGDGPHEVRVHNGLYLRTDAFASNPASLTPYQPLIEWYDDEPAGNGAPFFGTVGIAASVAAGDVTGDGQIEIVVTADDSQNFGTLFLYHGDGRDSGDGDPIIWEIPFGGGAFRTWLGTPTIGDLDGQPGAEIIVNVGDELYALHGDGTTYWVTDTVSAFEVMSAPALANLDADPAPEIVVNIGNNVYIFEPDGTKIWETTLPAVALPPVVADLTGDGLPDLFLSAWDDTVYLYEYNDGTPQLAWSQTMPGTLAGMFGSAAVADVDGLQLGGDPGPELVISSNGFLTVLEANGDELWTTPLDPGNPGGVSVADLDGDGEVELVTGMRYDDGIGIGRLYALNADGTMLWDVPAYDSTSANVASVLDLNGDGVYEVAWNGKEQGFTLFNGPDGSVLFNEPLAFSLTGTDYPAIVDVDLDGYAEVIVPALRGIRVFGMDGAWGPARSVWNQQTYHITNVNDDLTIPAYETNSWETHNTYRTQWPESSALPVYDVVLTHTAGVNNQTVLTNTFSTPPSHSADPVYRWDYTQTWAQQTVTRTFVSELTDLQPGETRQVAAGTEVAYRLPSGFNTLTLPPLYVTAPRLGELTPAEQTAAVGSTAVYTLTLSNPTSSAATYSLAAGGLPAGWLNYPASIEIGAGETVAVNIDAAVPVNTPPDSLPLWVDVDNGGGGTDSFQATLHLVEAVRLTLAPFSQLGTTGQPLSYTLTISNLETTAQSYALTAVGLANVSFSGSPTVTVPASSALDVMFTAVPPAEGAQPFAITATSTTSASAVADGVAVGVGRWAVLAEATPEMVVAGPGSTAVVTLTLSNVGDVADTYALSMDAPAGWDSQLTHVGQPVSEMAVLAGAFNTADLRWFITPNITALPGSYPVTVTTQSLSQPGVLDTAVVLVEVGQRGVTVAITPANQAINPNAPASWNVTVTNRGSVADSYALTASGVPALAGSFSAEQTGTLAPGASQTVQLMTEALGFLLPGTRQFAVLAQSVGDVRVQAEDTAVFTLADAPGVAVEWLPASKTVTDTLTTGLMLVLTNTGGTLETFDLTVSGAGLLAQPTLKRLVVSPQSAVAVWIPVWAATAGQYEVTATASGAGTPASATADLTFASTNVVEPNSAPTVEAGVDVATVYNTAVLFSGSYLDPDGPEPYTIAWDFGDGNTVSGSLTASHSYATEGVYTVTLTVTDGLGAVGTDTLQVAVTYPTTYLPIIMRAP